MSQLGMDLRVEGFLRCLAAEDIRGLNFLDDTSATFSKEEHTLTHSHLSKQALLARRLLQHILI